MNNLKGLDRNIFDTLASSVVINSSKYNEINNMLFQLQEYIFGINIYKKNSQLDDKEIFDKYPKYLEKYHYSILLNLVKELSEYSNKKDIVSYFDNEIKTDVLYSTNLNPYDQYMKKLNTLYKIYKLKLFNHIVKSYKDRSLSSLLQSEDLKKFDIYKELHSFYTMSIYIDGFLFGSSFNDTFSVRNFMEYPNGEQNFLKKDEFFVMGDNRYNSLDSRLGYVNREERLDKDDSGEFCKKVITKWKPHTIKMKHILGKAVAIYFPVDRMGFLK